MTQSYRASHSGSQLHFQVFRDVIFAETDDCYAAAAPLRAAAFLPIRINMKETQNQSTSLKRPIRRTLIILATTFILVVSALSILLSYAFVTSIVQEENSKRLTDIISIVESQIDIDDLGQCKETGVKSQKYVDLQLYLNDFIDRVGLMYLYIVVPVDEGLINVISATSQAERDAGEEDYELGYLEQGYSKSELKHYLNSYNTDGISCFEENSDYGTYFTACKPLKNSSDEKVALLCADIDIKSLHKTIAQMMLLIGASVVGSIGVFSVVILLLIRKNVTGPLFALEKSARTFADEIKKSQSINEVEYEFPAVKTGNEVQSLAEAMRYVAISLKENAEKAETDALTGLKNMHAYIDAQSQINQSIESGTPTPFAIVVFDINNLKGVNDTLGHVAGDEYIRKGSKLICDTFKHSPVYRIGGDEFAVIAQGVDYENVDELMKEIKKRNEENALAGEVTVACGMKKHEREIDVASVFKKADDLMYQDKRNKKTC